MPTYGEALAFAQAMKMREESFKGVRRTPTLLDLRLGVDYYLRTKIIKPDAQDFLHCVVADQALDLLLGMPNLYWLWEVLAHSVDPCDRAFVNAPFSKINSESVAQAIEKIRDENSWAQSLLSKQKMTAIDLSRLLLAGIVLLDEQNGCLVFNSLFQGQDRTIVETGMVHL